MMRHYPKIKVADRKWLVTFEKQLYAQGQDAPGKDFIKHHLDGNLHHHYPAALTHAGDARGRIDYAGLSIAVRPAGPGPGAQHTTLALSDIDESINWLALLMRFSPSPAFAEWDSQYGRFEAKALRDDGHRQVALAVESNPKTPASLYFRHPDLGQSRVFLSFAQAAQITGLLAGIVAFNMDLPEAEAVRIVSLQAKFSANAGAGG